VGGERGGLWKGQTQPRKAPGNGVFGYIGGGEIGPRLKPKRQLENKHFLLTREWGVYEGGWDKVAIHKDLYLGETTVSQPRDHETGKLEKCSATIKEAPRKMEISILKWSMDRGPKGEKGLNLETNEA